MVIQFYEYHRSVLKGSGEIKWNEILKHPKDFSRTPGVERVS